MSKLRITTKRRSGDWIAFLTEQPAVWDAGRTELEAIGRLIMSLTAYDVVELTQEGAAQK